MPRGCGPGFGGFCIHKTSVSSRNPFDFSESITNRLHHAKVRVSIGTIVLYGLCDGALAAYEACSFLGPSSMNRLGVSNMKVAISGGLYF